MNPWQLLDKSLCDPDFRAVDKGDALRQIAERAARAPALNDLGVENLHRLLAEREQEVSTGLGGGFAIPHARVQGLSEFVMFMVVSSKGIDFDALDDEKVQVFVVIFAPANRDKEHLRLLATVSRVLAKRSILKELTAAKTEEALHETFARALTDEEAPSSTPQGRKKLFLITLFYEADLDDVLEYLIEYGIEGATVIDGKNMGSYVSAMPLFASFLGFMREDQEGAKIIMTLIDAGIEQALVKGIERITGNLDKRQGALLLSLDVSFAKGTLSMI